MTRSFRQSYPLRNRITASTGDVRPETLSERPKHPRGAVDQSSKPAEQGAYFPVKKQKRGKRKKKIRAYDNPSGAARHLPLHKGGFGRRRKREK